MERTLQHGGRPFELVSQYRPAGDQGPAITRLSSLLAGQESKAVLRGVTGSGKTYTMASVIQNVGRPALVLTHNKTLAAQLFREFKDFFPNNAVEYFVSYYDYYQPEAYVPTSDTYIEKDSSINDEIDRLRLRATAALLERDDVIIVSSVSCIYGLGSPEDYTHGLIYLKVGDRLERDDFARKLVFIQYERNDVDFSRGRFRIRGDVVEVFPAYHNEGVRLEFFGDELESIARIDPLTGRTLEKMDRVAIYPAKHFITSPPKLKEAVFDIQDELNEQVAFFKKEGKLLEAERIESRTNYDLEMLTQMGYCNGIENYSRHLTRRQPGERPACLIDYFPRDFLLLVDESHVTIPQVGGMYAGDRSRKETLVNFGFRLPSALDNRPLNFGEFEKLAKNVLYVSATPAAYEMNEAGKAVVDQLIRPTGLLDPPIEIRTKQNQVQDLLKEINRTVKEDLRVFVTVLTKKMAESLTDYLQEAGVKVRYLHSEIETIERVELIKGLRMGQFDVLVGINLMREGLDCPEVGLVAILDADQEGFLRSGTSLIQTAGRAARNSLGRVIFYADRVTDSMQKTIDETERRRAIQMAHNEKHGITPTTIKKDIHDILQRSAGNSQEQETERLVKEIKQEVDFDAKDKKQLTAALQQAMLTAAKNLEFEKAAILRDKLQEMEKGKANAKTGKSAERPARPHSQKGADRPEGPSSE